MTAARLRERGITGLIQVRTVDPALLREAVGSSADWLIDLANGRDDRRVTPDRKAKSSSSEETYSHDLEDFNMMQEEVSAMARENAEWLVEPPFASKSRNSAFLGRRLRGRVVHTMLRGSLVVSDGKAQL